MVSTHHSPFTERVQLTVETPESGLRLIRVTGALDRAAAATLLRLLDAQLHEAAGRRLRTTHVLVDLSGVRSFEPGGLETLRHARHCAARSGIGIHLTGCTDRSPHLPLRACQLLTEFHTYPTTEVALAALTDGGQGPGHGSSSAPRHIGRADRRSGPGSHLAWSSVEGTGRPSGTDCKGWASSPRPGAATGAPSTGA